jgi:hypothetical protein
MLLHQHRLPLTCDIEVHERKPDLREISRLAHQPAVDLHLRPVQMPVIGRHTIEIAAIGFELFELVLLRVVTIRAAANAQRAVLAGEPDFCFVVFATTRGDERVARDAFHCRRRRREPQVQISLFRCEFAQRAHGHLV